MGTKHCFHKGFTYSSEFTSATGDRIRIESVCIYIPGVKPEELIKTWNYQAGGGVPRYTLLEHISIQDALNIQTRPNSLSLQGKIDLIGTECDYINVEYRLEYI